MKGKWTFSLLAACILSFMVQAQAADPQENMPAAMPKTLLEIVLQGDLPALQALAEKDRAVLAFKDDRGRALLHLASAAGHLEMAGWLIGRGAAIDARTAEMSTPLMHAALSGKTDMARLLISKGADLAVRDGYQRSALILVARERGDVEMAGILLDEGADINAVDRSNDSSLSLAAWRGFTGLIDLLLERGAALPAEAETKRLLFRLSLSKGLDRLFDKLLASGFDVAGAARSPARFLHAAADGGSTHILNKLLEYKIDVNLKDDNDWTPLHRAAERGHAQAAALLIERGARLNSRNLAGETPYNLAAAEKNDEIVALLKAKGADLNPPAFPQLAGEYLGQKKPGAQPELFAPGIVSGRFGVHCPAIFSPDGREVYWNLMITPLRSGYSRNRLLVSRLQDGRWTYPQVAFFSDEERDADVPFFSPDGKRLYFMSRRPLPGQNESSGEHIWFMEQKGGGWTEARPVDEAVNSLPQHWQFSVDKDHNLYFATTVSGGLGKGDIYAAQFENGRYRAPQNLGAPVNTSGMEGQPFIAADGSYLLFARDYDLYISFRAKDGAWSAPVSLGADINSPGQDLSPVVSADGKYLFFLSNRGGESHTWWVSAEIITALKPRVRQ